MSAYRLLFCVLCILFIITCGCTSIAIGEVTPSPEGLAIHVLNNGERVDAGVLVRVYEIKDMVQKELTSAGVPVSLGKGDTAVSMPLRLGPGTYKVYVYVMVNNERVTASIKDIVV